MRGHWRSPWSSAASPARACMQVPFIPSALGTPLQLREAPGSLRRLLRHVLLRCIQPLTDPRKCGLRTLCTCVCSTRRVLPLDCSRSTRWLMGLQQLCALRTAIVLAWSRTALLAGAECRASARAHVFLRCQLAEALLKLRQHAAALRGRSLRRGLGRALAGNARARLRSLHRQHSRIGLHSAYARAMKAADTCVALDRFWLHLQGDVRVHAVCRHLRRGCIQLALAGADELFQALVTLG